MVVDFNFQGIPMDKDAKMQKTGLFIICPFQPYATRTKIMASQPTFLNVAYPRRKKALLTAY